ncbi:ATP-binding protein [Clostridium sp. CF012]|uniref:ATP-binding protein n=1 Tax=Clostridium sp. CF012 TaxID=2843319 RepID=UPI001C0E0870|nr:ATP-binding protein [Clostridium sp. CF012]MBU3143214.1 ATP-binding protein [Clostridium sp. CF012]
MNKLLTSKLRFMNVLFILFSILLGLQCTVHAATSVKITDKEIKSLVETEVTNLINKKTTKGAVVSIIKDDKSILCRGYGYADNGGSGLGLAIVKSIAEKHKGTIRARYFYTYRAPYIYKLTLI